MKSTIILILIILTHSVGTGQELCSGPMDVTVMGSGSGSPISVEHYSYDIFCLGLDEGAIELVVNGGTPEYTCTWNTGEVSEELIDLAAGTYQVTITDGNNCVDSLSIEIQEIHPVTNDMYLLEEDGCGACALSDSIGSYFYDGIDYMMYIEDIYDGIDLGELQVCTEIHSGPIEVGRYPSLGRSWCLDSEGGSATIRLFFSDEEFKALMDEAEVSYIKSTNLIVSAFSGGEKNIDDFEIQLEIANISLALFDNINNVWSVEFTIDDLPEGSTCFYLSYIKDEDDKTIDELTSHIEGADFILLGNPVIDELRLQVNHIGCVLSGNIYIEDAIQQLIYKSTFVDSYLGTLTFDVHHYPAGVYFLTIEFPKAKISKTFKFMKVYQ